MTIHYGKRNGGALTAASPGDTLYIPLAFYNDSGASIGIGSTLAVTDIEVFKNGSVTQRATDSGYAILGDTGNFDNRIGFKGISISLFNTADDSTFYAVGSSYWVAIDAVTVDARTVRFWPAVFEIGEPRANIVQIGGDTGAANYLRTTFAAGFADTGINDNLSRIRADVDTGLRVHIDDLDTGLHAHISDVDTGLHSILQTVGVLVAAFSDTGVNERLARIQSDVDTGLRTHISDLDTGLHDTLSDYDTGLRGILLTTGVNLGLIRGDTGGADRFYRYTQKLDTGGDATVSASVDTGQVNQAVWQANAVRGITAIADTGMNERFARIQSDVDTGLRVHIDDLDTGLHAHIADVDTGIHSILQTVGVLVSAFSDTGVNNRLAVIASDVDTGFQNADIGRVRGDTGAGQRLFRFLEKLDTGGDLSVSASVDTGIVNQAVWQANAARSITASSDTGVNQRLAQIQSDVDTGLRTHINDLDTGLHDTLADYDTGLRGILVTTGVNLGLIRGDTGAANQLRVTYADGFNDTGINQRFGAIGQSTGSALSTDATTDNTAGGISGVTSGTTFVGSQTGTFANTEAQDLSYHVITHSGNAIDIVYQFLIGGGTAPVLCVWIGYLTGSNDQFTISAWNHETNAWDLMATIDGQPGTTNLMHNCPLFRRYVGTSVAELGKVYIRLHCTGQTSPVLNTDQLYVSYAVTSTDTGVNDRLAKILADTDTGIQSSVNVTTFADTGVNQRFAQIQSDVDTGLRTHINDLDTGLHDTLADYDTGMRALLTLRDTGAIASAVWGFATRGVTNVIDTGIDARLAAITTKTASLTFTVAGQVDANIQYVNDTQVVGVGDTGTANTWRPV